MVAEEYTEKKHTGRLQIGPTVLTRRVYMTKPVEVDYLVWNGAYAGTYVECELPDGTKRTLAGPPHIGQPASDIVTIEEVALRLMESAGREYKDLSEKNTRTPYEERLFGELSGLFKISG